MDKSTFIKQIMKISVDVAKEMNLDEKHTHNLVHASHKVISDIYDAGFFDYLKKIDKETDTSSIAFYFGSSEKNCPFCIHIFSNQQNIFRTSIGKTMKPAKITSREAVSRLNNFLIKLNLI